MIKKTALILATVMAGLLGVTAVSTPAHAAAPNPCPYKFICWYDRNDWTSFNYLAAPWTLSPNTCYNMGYDPNTGVNWNELADSVWWSDGGLPGAYVEFYEGFNCTIRSITRAFPAGLAMDQLQSCTEPVNVWNGPCGPPNFVAKRISSWAFSYS